MAAVTLSQDDSTAPRKVYLYFGSLTLLVYLTLPHGPLLDVATSYMLKNQLHASATQVSTFRLLSALPVYLAFLFGLARDRWSPFGLRDRGYFLLFAPLSVAAFLWMAYSPLSYSGLFSGLLLLMVSFRFITAAYQGLIALVGQERLMSGRLSALWNTVSFIPWIGGAFASGYVTEHLHPRQIFILVATLTALIAVLGLLKPRAVFSQTYDQPQARRGRLVADLKRLVRHRAVYPAALVMLIFQFSPGSNTPLQFYLTNELHASDAAYANYSGIFLLSFIPAFLLYGYLCRRVSLRTLLIWATVITIPQMVPLAFVHSADMALLLAVPSGLMGGLAQAAYIDLAMRSCPSGLQGTLMMTVDGMTQLSYRGGDVVGSWIYASNPGHGFLYCVLTTTAAYALILPVLLLIPKDVVSTADGERASSASAYAP